MKFRICYPLFIFAIVLFFSCSEDTPNPKPSNPITGTTIIKLSKLEDALNNKNQKFVNLLNKIRGSVGTSGPGSKVIWSRKNTSGLGIYVSANHVINLNNWNSRNEGFIDPAKINWGVFVGSKIPPVSGKISLGNTLSASFPFYHPQIPASATNTTILPANDFYIGIIDNQKVIDNGLGQSPSLLQTKTPLEMYDPNNRTKMAQTWASVTPGDTIVALGYPQNKNSYPNGAVSSGTIYSDNDAENIITKLKLAGDEEGNIPYNSDVEFIAKAKGVAGMSGGGVFNKEGQLIGIMVRATKLNNEPILRVVRLSYIRSKIITFYNTLSSSDRTKFSFYIGEEL
ncbi:serine protease [Prolixibacteraceae bacterium JC049]|nr:serine protease [Prolixibacteraceae bacterium JC049]